MKWLTSKKILLLGNIYIPYTNLKLCILRYDLKLNLVTPTAILRTNQSINQAVQRCLETEHGQIHNKCHKILYGSNCRMLVFVKFCLFLRVRAIPFLLPRILLLNLVLCHLPRHMLRDFSHPERLWSRRGGSWQSLLNPGSIFLPSLVEWMWYYIVVVWCLVVLYQLYTSSSSSTPPAHVSIFLPS